MMFAVPVVALMVYLVLIVAALVTTGFRRRAIAAKARSSAISYGSAKAPSLVVILVHGTWAQDANWTLPGSVLCHEISRGLPNTLFHRFRWSGRNTIGARYRAARALKRELAHIAISYPNSARVIVAHSHGGNIGLQALNDSSPDADVGLICLATPVIVSRHRYFDDAAVRLRPLRFAIPFAAWFVGVLMFLKAVLIVTVVVSAVSLLVFVYGAKVLKRTGQFLDDTNYRNISANNVLFIRAPGDEASAVIAAVQGLTWVLTTLIQLPVRLARIGDEQIETWRKRLGMRFLWVCIALFVSSVVIAYGAWQLDNPGIQKALFILAAILFFVPPLFCLGLYSGGYVGVMAGYATYPFLLFPVLLLMLLSGIAIGPEMTAASLARDVTVEPCPRGTWNVVMLGDLEPIASRDLQHSVIYRSEEGCDAIVAWITGFLSRAVGVACAAAVLRP